MNKTDLNLCPQGVDTLWRKKTLAQILIIQYAKCNDRNVYWRLWVGWVKHRREMKGRGIKLQSSYLHAPQDNTAKFSRQLDLIPHIPSFCAVVQIAPVLTLPIGASELALQIHLLSNRAGQRGQSEFLLVGGRGSRQGMVVADQQAWAAWKKCRHL